MIRRARRGAGTALVVVAALGSAACEEAFLDLPRNPGTVSVTVTDDAQQAVANADVSVSATNNSGGTYYIGTKTRSDGRSVISGISAGTQTVQVTPPSSHMAGTDSLKKTIQVVKGQTTAVTFVLRRKQP